MVVHCDLHGPTVGLQLYTVILDESGPYTGVDCRLKWPMDLSGPWTRPCTGVDQSGQRLRLDRRQEWIMASGLEWTSGHEY